MPDDNFCSSVVFTRLSSLYRRNLFILKRAFVKKKPLLVANLLSRSNSNPASLISEAKRLSQLKIIINQSLDQALAEHVFVSTLKNGQLTLVVDSPVWATRLRYMQNEIINRLKKFTMGKNVNHITVKVRPLDFQTSAKAQKRRKISLSKSSASRMSEELEAISDPALKDSLKRILKHAK